MNLEKKENKTIPLKMRKFTMYYIFFSNLIELLRRNLINICLAEQSNMA